MAATAVAEVNLVKKVTTLLVAMILVPRQTVSDYRLDTGLL